MMNSSRICRQFSRSVNRYSENAIAQRVIAQNLSNLLMQYSTIKPKAILEVGCGTGFLTETLTAQFSPSRYLLNDLSPQMVAQSRSLLNASLIEIAEGDAENIEFSNGFDLIASSAAIQWFNSPKRFFEKIALCLNQNGVIAFSSFTSRNLFQITELCGKRLPYPNLTTELPPCFSPLHYSETEITLSFSSPQAVLKHLRATGVNGVTSQGWTRGDMVRFVAEYQNRYATPQGVSLTYTPCYLIARLQPTYLNLI